MGRERKGWREICEDIQKSPRLTHQGKYLVEQDVLRGLRDTYERELLAAERRVGELEGALRTLVDDIDRWEDAVQKIVGKREYPWGNLEEARRLVGLDPGAPSEADPEAGEGR